MQEFWILVNEMAPYLLLGFGFAGLLHAFVPPAVFRKQLGDSSFKSVLWAALLGIPLPLCSCGVIPTAMSMRKEGASKGATTSFLIATPQTGIDSIMATAALLGIPFAILRPVAALATALIGGEAVNLLTRTDQPSGTCSAPGPAPAKSFGSRCIEALRYGYVDMVQDIGRWLFLGLVAAALITTFVPADFFLGFADQPLIGMLAILFVSIPMYVCATGSIPIAAALMLKGLSPGAALVLLMAGPASNMASILVIRKVMGHKTLWIYLSCITLGAIAFGLGIDYLLPREWFSPTYIQAKACCHEGPAAFNILCSTLLGVLLLYALIRRFIPKNTLQTMETKTFKVKGMMCNHCRANVEEALKQLPGVESVEVDLAGGTAKVNGSADDKQIISAIVARGYEASKID